MTVTTDDAHVCGPGDAPGGGQGDDGGLVVRCFALPTAFPGELAWYGEAFWVTDLEAGNLIPGCHTPVMHTGQRLSPGVYFVSLGSGQTRQSRKLVVSQP